MFARTLGGETVAPGRGTGFWFDPAYADFLEGVRRATPPGTTAVIRGSCVTGERWKDGAAFDSDGPGTSDMDLTLVGEHDERAGATLEEAFRTILADPSSVRRMTLENAELAKKSKTRIKFLRA